MIPGIFKEIPSEVLGAILTIPEEYQKKLLKELQEEFLKEKAL